MFLSKKILLFIFCLLSGALHAQIKERESHHSHHKNEIGIGNSLVYFPKEEVLSYGLHIHYTRTFLHSYRLGVGYERIFDEHGHNSLGILFGYSPIEKLSLNISPALAFEDNVHEFGWALHLESSYDFEWHDFHWGPILEFAIDEEDMHFGVGLHIGLGF